MRLHARAPWTLRLGLAATGLLTLAGCGIEAARPAVTVFPGSGGSIRQEALCWSQDGKPITECQGTRKDLDVVQVRANTPLAINVDGDLARIGWVPALDGQALVPEPLKNSHYTFSLTEEQIRAKPELQVFALDRIGAPPRGIWGFEVEQKGLEEDARRNLE